MAAGGRQGAASVKGPGKVYGLHGLRLRSAVPLAGVPHDDEAFDVDICWSVGPSVPVAAPPGRLLLAHVGGGVTRYLAADDGARTTLRVPGQCDLVIDADRRAVEARVDPSADARLVAVLIAGLGVAFLLSTAGSCVLHASAVEVTGRGIAFAGPSGAGKSTLAALLCGAGARLVTDDVLRVGMDPGPVCVGGAPQLRLRPRGAWALDTFRTAPPSSTTVDQRLAVSPPPAVDAVPLAVVVLPRVSPAATRPEMRPLEGAQALIHLAAASRITGWTDPVLAAQQFRTMAEVADRVSVLELTLPFGAALPPSIAGDLLAHDGNPG